MFAAKNLLLTPPIAAAAPITFDAVTATGVTADNGSTTLAFTAAVGADVFLVISVDTGGITFSSVQYGAAAMTQLVSTNSGSGTMGLYRIAGGGSGSSKNLTFTTSGVSNDVFGLGFSYKNVTSASATTASGTGTTTGSQSITITSGQLAVALLIGDYPFGGVTAWPTISGGTSRINQADTRNNNVIAIRDATTTTTFSATESAINGWGVIKLILS